jgi:GNAT superfamily N-acetyltransferase
LNSVDVIGSVAETARGQSLGQKLVTPALGWFWAEGMTQGRNIRGQPLYQRAGFLTQSMGLWYHWWHDEQPRV